MHDHCNFEAEAAAGLRYLQRLGADCLPCDGWTSVHSKTTRPMPVSAYMSRFYARGNFFDNIVCDVSNVGKEVVHANNSSDMPAKET